MLTNKVLCSTCLFSSFRYVGDGAIAPCSTGAPCHAQLGAEIQIVNIFSQFTGTFTAGEFKLSYNGVKSSCLTAGASAAQVQTALVSIPALAGVSVISCVLGCRLLAFGTGLVVANSAVVVAAAVIALPGLTSACMCCGLCWFFS